MLFYVNSFAYEVLFLINGQVKYNLSYVRLINRMNNKDLRVLYLRSGFSQTVVDVNGVIFFYTRAEIATTYSNFYQVPS
mgnify:FL=1